MSAFKLLVLPFSAILFVSTVKAQEAYDVPEAEVGLNYSYFQVGEGPGDSSHLPLGWQLSLDGNVTSWLGLVAEFSGHYGDRNLAGFVEPPDQGLFDDLTDINSDIHTFQIGPRFFYRQAGSIVPFGHVLFGLARIHTDLDNAIFPTVGFDDVQTPFVVTFGGGIDLQASPMVGIRAVQVDYLQTRMNDLPQHYMKVSAGINFKWHR